MKKAIGAFIITLHLRLAKLSVPLSISIVPLLSVLICSSVSRNILSKRLPYSWAGDGFSFEQGRERLHPRGGVQRIKNNAPVACISFQNFKSSSAYISQVIMSVTNCKKGYVDLVQELSVTVKRSLREPGELKSEA